METYRILNNKAKNWWYFKELRNRGQLSEARKKERESILKEIDCLRSARNKGYLKIARLGSSITYKKDNCEAYCEKHGSDDYHNMVIDLGIPTIDTSSLSLSEAIDLCNMPLLKYWLTKDEKHIRDNGKLSSMAYVTKDTYRKLITERFGDKVKFYNW